MDKFDLNSKLFWWTAGPRYMPEGQAPGPRLLRRDGPGRPGNDRHRTHYPGGLAWLLFPISVVGIPIGLIGLAMLWMAFGGWRERHLFRGDPQPRSEAS